MSLDLESVFCIIELGKRKYYKAAWFKHTTNYHIQIIGFFVDKDLVF